MRFYGVKENIFKKWYFYVIVIFQFFWYVDKQVEAGVYGGIAGTFGLLTGVIFVWFILIYLFLWLKVNVFFRKKP